MLHFKWAFHCSEQCDSEWWFKFSVSFLSISLSNFPFLSHYSSAGPFGRHIFRHSLTSHRQLPFTLPLTITNCHSAAVHCQIVWTALSASLSHTHTLHPRPALIVVLCCCGRCLISPSFVFSVSVLVVAVIVIYSISIRTVSVYGRGEMVVSHWCQYFLSHTS